jgi:hypothetical protein
MSTINIEGNYQWAADYLTNCDNCGCQADNHNIDPIVDAEQRLTPGEETPAGQCRDCGALVFLNKVT